MTVDYVEYIECPCCGDVGARADDCGLFADGQDLVCGCKGSVSYDAENEPYIRADDCDCGDSAIRREAIEECAKQCDVADGHYLGETIRARILGLLEDK